MVACRKPPSCCVLIWKRESSLVSLTRALILSWAISLLTHQDHISKFHNISEVDVNCRLVLAKGIGHLPLCRLNPVMLQLPNFNIPSREFRVESEALCSVTQSCLTLCDPMDCSTPGFPVLHHLLELAQIHVHWVGDATQPSHPLLPPSPLAFGL